MTTDDLLDLRGIGQRASTFRFNVLDRTLSIIGKIQPTMDTANAPTVENVMNRGVKRAMRGLTLPPGTRDELNPFTDRLQPVMLMENGDSQEFGVFMFLAPSEAERSWGTTLGTDLGDQGLQLDQPIAQNLGFAAGTPITDALDFCFQLQGFLPGTYTIDQMSAVVGEAGPIGWRIGTSLLRIMNQLCAMAGCYSVFFDRFGFGRVQTQQDLLTTEPTVRYRTGDAGNVLNGSIIRTAQAVFAPNRYVAVDASANTAPIVGTYTVPATAPNSFENIGYYRTKALVQQGLQDEFAAQMLAQAAAAQDAADYEWVSISSVIDPRLDTFAIVDLFGERYRSQKWGPVQLLEGAVMPHDLRKIYVDAA